jgi:hypothetical protein
MTTHDIEQVEQVAPPAPRRRRQRAPSRWTPELVAMLGKISDAEFAASLAPLDRIGYRIYSQGMNTIAVSRSDKSIRAILAACYPAWRGRKVRVKPATTYRMSAFWADGSRDEVKAYNLVDGTVADPRSAACNPMNAAAHVEIDIPVGVLLVEHSVFMGKDAGVTIHVHPSSLAPLLPKADAAPAVAAE